MHLAKAYILSTLPKNHFTMKRILLFHLLLMIGHYCNAQTYISIAPSLTNTAGTIAEKGNLAIEVGRQWNVFSLGLDMGKTSFSTNSRDTTVYLELRPNLNIFQQGNFTNTFTAGIGYIFNAKEQLMTELTSGIEYALNHRVHFNIVFGQYFYSGKESASNVTFFGLSAMFYITKAKDGSLFKPEEKKQ